MKNISEYLKEKYGVWGWLGQRAHDAEGINHILPLEVIISCNYGREVPLFFNAEDVFSVEKKKKVRKNWSNEDLASSLKGSLGNEVFSRLEKHKKGVNLICYRSVRRLENTANGVKNFRIFAMPERLKKHFDSKVLLFKNLERLGLNTIKSRLENPSKTTFKALKEEFKLPFVVQYPYGSSGSSTYIIKKEQEYLKVLKENKGPLAVIRKYISGFSFNGNAVIVSAGGGTRTITSYPSMQITGRPECSSFKSAFCGNDYTSSREVDKKLIKETERQMKIAGKWMGKAGFRGVFGMDFVVEDGVVYPVEINPRFQNSTSLYTVMKDIEGRSDKNLFLLHIAEFLQKKDKEMKKYIENFPHEVLMEPTRGAQVIIHNKKKKPMVVSGELNPGIYTEKDGNFVFSSESASLRDCRRGDVLITCGVPSPNTRVEADAPICKIQVLDSALEQESRKKLNSRMKRIVSFVYRKLSLKEPQKLEMAGV